MRYAIQIIFFPGMVLAQCVSPGVTASSYLTPSHVPYATGSSPGCNIDDSSITIDVNGNMNSVGGVNAGYFNLLAPVYTSTPPNGVGLISVTILNSTSPPAVGGLACWDTLSPGTAVGCNTGNTRVIGVTYNNAITINTLSYSQVVRMGSVNCNFDSGGVSIGDYVTISPTAGDCKDGGASPYPTSGQVVGVALTSGTGSGAYQIFAMNDLPTPGAVFAGVGTGNTYAASTAQNMSLAGSLTIPLNTSMTITGSPVTATDGSIAYDTASQQYQFGEAALDTPVYPVMSAPTVVVPSPTDIICANHSDSGCQNSTTDDVPGSGPFGFLGAYYTFPGGFYATVGRTVRITYLFSLISSATPAKITFFELWRVSPTSAVPIYESSQITPPASQTGGGTDTFQLICTTTATNITVGSQSLLEYCVFNPLPPGAASQATVTNLIPQPVTVDLTTSHSLIFAPLYSVNTSGNTLTLLSATTEVLQ